MNFEIHHHGTVDSTMRLAAPLPVGHVVVADEQTAGQGRHGHSWYSAKGAGLYCSIVLKPTPLLTLALGLAAAEAIAETAGVGCDLRWPNDMMVGEKKLGGILVQLSEGKAMAGIGINLNQVSFPPEIAATSLKIETGREASAAALLDALLAAVAAHVALPGEDILRLFTRASSYAAGRRVVVHQPGGTVEGTTAGLDANGFLIVRQDDGTDTLIVAGGVRAAGT